MLASVYYKPPEQFVKKLRDKINERFDLETDEIVDRTTEYVDSTGVKRSEYTKSATNENYEAYFAGKGDLLDMEDVTVPVTKPEE